MNTDSENFYTDSHYLLNAPHRKALRQHKPPPMLWIFSIVFDGCQHHMQWKLALSGNGKESFNPMPLSWAKSNHQPATFCVILLPKEQTDR